MLGQATNQMLQQAEEGIQAKVPQNLQDGLARVVHAGLTIMYSEKLAAQRNARIASSTDPVKDAGEGAARMMVNLYQQSGKKMPTDLIVPGAMILAFEYLDLVAKAGKADITPDLIARATQSVADAVLPVLGITKDKLAKIMAAQEGQGAAPEPGQPGTPAPAGPAQAAPQGIIGAAQGA
jgi:hypothetical protein